MSKTADWCAVCSVLPMSASDSISVFVGPSRSQVRTRLPVSVSSLAARAQPRPPRSCRYTRVRAGGGNQACNLRAPGFSGHTPRHMLQQVLLIPSQARWPVCVLQASRAQPGMVSTHTATLQDQGTGHGLQPLLKDQIEITPFPSQRGSGRLGPEKPSLASQGAISPSHCWFMWRKKL